MNIDWKLEQIPKVCHFYWSGKTLPFIRFLSILSFSKYNPDWKIKFHTSNLNENIKNLKWVNKTEDYDAIKIFSDCYFKKLQEIPFLEVVEHKKTIKDINEVAFSDILRWKILSTEGGVWSDMDIVFIKPLSLLEINLEENKQHSTFLCLETRCVREVGSTFLIGFLMSTPENNFFKEILERSLLSYNTKDYQSCGNKLLEDITPNNTKFCNIFYDIFYYFNDLKIENILTDIPIDCLPDESIGIHWYGGSLKMKEIKNLSPQALQEHKSLLGYAIKEVLGD